MKTFPIGGTGFIGPHFINLGLSKRHELVCLRRPGTNTRIPLIKDS
jgi:hypothetical protein